MRNCSIIPIYRFLHGAARAMKKPLTPEQVKEQFQKRGQTFSAWAEQHGYRTNEVYRVLNGQSKAKYGKCHEIAIKLGLKVDSSQQAA
jgi:gp16 family phage-associated protein